MMSGDIIRKGALAILSLSALVFFGLHVREVIEKVLEQRTTFSNNQESHKTLYPPAITLCPGQIYNIVKRRELFNLTSDPFSLTYPLKNKNMSVFDQYREFAYILDKDFTIQWQLSSNMFLNLSLGINKIENEPKYGNFEVDIEELFTLSSGLCYVVSAYNKMDETILSFIGLFLDYLVPDKELPTSLNGFLAPKQDYPGVMYKSWKGSMPFAFEVPLGSSNMLSITKQSWLYYQNKNDRECVEYPEEQTCAHYYSTVMIQTALEQSKCEPFCVNVKTKALFDIANMTDTIMECRTPEEDLCMYYALVSPKAIASAEVECKTPCQVTQYKTEVTRHADVFPKSRAYIGLVYRTTSVTINEEYLVYDFSSFIGSVGGSLGLFIGFSYFDFGNVIIKAFWRKT
jgi:hypothetical protein